ncbi:MAG: mechanosensitive ion channel [Oscillospiraceae bacterium]|nr:mechanosensitive ion channel [Oscillospiraceae bacterium]
MIIINTDITVTSVTEQITETTSQVSEMNVVDVISEKAEETATIFTKLSEMFSEKFPVLIFAVIVLILGIVSSKIILKMISKMIGKSTLDKTANGFFHSFISAILYTVVVIIALNIIGVPMASIITILGAAGLALSLALQQCLSNIAGGFIILFSKPFKVGDFIELNGISGEVEGISILYTKLLTADHKLSYIPNGIAANDKIINYTVTKTRRLDLVFSISYDSDFRKAQSLINEIIEKNPKVIKTPAPVVRMTAHNTSSIDIDCKVWVKSGEYFDLKYDLMEAVKETFDKNDIVIPYTTIDINMNK